jgi:hypothetical protein
MKTIKIIAIGIAASSLMLTACKKEETKSDSKPTGSSIIVGKDWRLIGMTRSTPGAPADDIFAQLPACEKDDLIEYLANGSLIDKAGATKCDPAELDSEITGTWALLNNDAQLRLINGDTTIINVQELSANTMRGYTTDADPVSGLTYTTSFTFTKN